MKDWKAKVLREKRALDEKATKLGVFLTTNQFQKLAQVQKRLLVEQLVLMHEYSSVLGSRAAS